MQIAKSYRIRLCLTHIVTAMVSGYCVWYGLQVKGFSRIAFMILLSAGIAVPCTVALRWLSLALKRMNSAFETVDTDEADTGLSEIDVATRRAIEALRQQRQLVSNVQELVARLRQTSGRGESGGTELLTDALGQLSRGTSRDIGSIMSLGDDIAKGIHDTHWSAQYQLHTVKAIGQSVDALSCRFDDIGQNAKHTNQSARQVSQDAAKGIGVINQVVRGMENVRTNVDFTEKKVAGLNQLSEQISSIVETMGNISARTDMLALNASIEAVRAGQEGRGFSIVAEEVRKLSDTTASASQEIAKLVAGIQNESTDAVAAIKEEREQVHQELHRIRQAVDAFESISQSSAGAAEHSLEIANTSVEQLQATRDVVRSIQEISTSATRISEQSDSVRHKTSDLIAVANELEDGLSPLYDFGGDATFLQPPVSVPEKAELPEQHMDAETGHPPDELLAAVVRGEL